MPYKDRTRQLEYWRDYRQKNRAHKKTLAHILYMKKREALLEANRRWNLKHPELRKKYNLACYYRHRTKYLANKRERLTGASKEMYDALVESQSGACAICGEPVKLYVDHNHLTKYVRGLLCLNCNAGLGFFQDNIARLRAAVDYLDRTP